MPGSEIQGKPIEDSRKEGQANLEKQLGLPSRESYWKELTVDQKVERMRTIVKEMSHRLDMAQELLASMRDAFQVHEHLNGRVMTPTQNSSRYEPSAVSGPLGRTPIANDEQTYF